MTCTPASQSLPVWNKETKNLIGIKLPVFINPKNLNQYSFILSIGQLVKSLSFSSIEYRPKMVEDKFNKISKAIVRVSAGRNYGTGVIIHPTGYVLTNLHVIGDFEKVNINDTINADVV
jgi:S1-C subfamily serine protease